MQPIFLVYDKWKFLLEKNYEIVHLQGVLACKSRNANDSVRIETSKNHLSLIYILTATSVSRRALVLTRREAGGGSKQNHALFDKSLHDLNVVSSNTKWTNI